MRSTGSRLGAPAPATLPALGEQPVWRVGEPVGATALNTVLNLPLRPEIRRLPRPASGGILAQTHMKHPTLATLLLAATLGAASVAHASGLKVITPIPEPAMEESTYGRLADGQEVKRFTLRNRNGASVALVTHGATITEINMPDRQGRMANVILAPASFEELAKGYPASAAVIGRFANRIAKAQFTLDGVTYKLAANNGPNHLHGGPKGFAQVNWRGELVPGKTAVRFSYLSKDREEGYPGSVHVAVTYTLTDDNELRLDYEATTDKATPINLTNHAYFNLAAQGDCLGHVLELAASQYTPADDLLIPTGQLASVKGTPLDFTKPEVVGSRVKQLLPKLNGYDHNFVIDNGGSTLTFAGRLSEPASGRTMEVHTTEPGVQIYTGNHVGHRGICLETQHYPDSVNQPQFPSPILRPGKPFKSTTLFRFGVAAK